MNQAGHPTLFGRRKTVNGSVKKHSADVPISQDVIGDLSVKTVEIADTTPTTKSDLWNNWALRFMASAAA
jgi:hypothetical protein